MNKTLKKILIGATLTLTALVLGTFLLPRHIHVERTATLSASPDKIYALAVSNAGYQRFNPYKNTDPNLSIELFGPEQGVGSGFRFDGEEGTGSQTIASCVANERIDYNIDLGDMGQPKQAIALSQTADGTEVTWSMDADMGMNPIGRVVGIFLPDMVGANFERGLSNLEAASSTSVASR